MLAKFHRRKGESTHRRCQFHRAVSTDKRATYMLVTAQYLLFRAMYLLLPDMVVGTIYGIRTVCSYAKAGKCGVVTTGSPYNSCGPICLIRACSNLTLCDLLSDEQSFDNLPHPSPPFPPFLLTRAYGMYYMVV